MAAPRAVRVLLTALFGALTILTAPEEQRVEEGPTKAGNTSLT